MRTLLLAAAALAAAVPLDAQPAARPPACLYEVSATAAGSGMTRYGCAGTAPGVNSAVRFSVSLPADWPVAVRDSSGMEIVAGRGGVLISVVGGDQLARPATRQDTAAFWTRAAGMMRGRDATPGEVEAFRDDANGRIASARDQLTRHQMTDGTLRAIAAEVSAAHAGDEVLRQEIDVRTLAGEPAGYIAEVLREGDGELRAVSYVTARDGALFLITLNVPEAEYSAILPVFERVLASFSPRTERW